MKPNRVTAALLVIGDEILSGRTKDKNIGAIAEHLTEIGIDLREVRIVPDIESDIVDALNALRARYRYVFTTGGIGPTHDDITAEAVAKAFGASIGIRDDARQVLADHYKTRGMELTEARLRMARVPDGAELIPNAISAAPGFMIGNVIVMAGVPEIMQVMLQAVTPKLETGSRTHSQTIPINRPESEIAAIFAAHQRAYPDILMGSYPRYRDGQPATDLVLRFTDSAILERCVNELRSKLGQ